MTTIVLADDHSVLRESLRSYLNAEPGLEVVGDTGDGLEVADLVERLRPDVLVADLMMPGLNGLEVTRQVKHRSPDTRVVILSMYADEAYVLEALRNGASGYVLKESPGAELVHAVREAVAGRHYLSQPLSERAIEVYSSRSADEDPDPYDALTGREREVLQLAAEGHTNAAIGDRLFISPRTVETHRANLMRKLGLRTQTDLISYAIKRGLVPMKD